MKTALFSGRFDPPHLGHIITIKKLFSKYKYDRVLVVILDYSEREGCSAGIAQKLFKQVFHSNKNPIEDVVLIQNKKHFGKITKSQLLTLADNNTEGVFEEITYVGGNKEVNKHMESLNYIPVEYIPRTIIYNSTAIREKISQGNSLEDQYNIKIQE